MIKDAILDLLVAILMGFILEMVQSVMSCALLKLCRRR